MCTPRSLPVAPMSVARVASVLLSLCCAAQSHEFVASLATCLSLDCIADDGTHALELLQRSAEVEDASRIEKTMSKSEVTMDQTNQKLKELQGKVKALEGMDAVGQGFVPNYQQAVIDTRDQLQKTQEAVTDEDERLLKAKEGALQESRPSLELLQEKLKQAQGQVEAEKAKFQEATAAAAEAQPKMEVKDVSLIEDKLSKSEVANERVKEVRGKIEALEGMDAAGQGFVPNFHQTVQSLRNQLQKAQEAATEEEKLEARKAAAQSLFKVREGTLHAARSSLELLQEQLKQAQGKSEAEQAEVDEATTAAAEAEFKLSEINQKVDADREQGTGQVGTVQNVQLAALKDEPATKVRPSLDPVKRLESSLSVGGDVKQALVQNTMEVKDASHIKDTLSKREEDMPIQMKAKQDKIEFLTSTNAYWRDRVKRLESSGSSGSRSSKDTSSK